jgi:hypothetical protein
MQNTLVNTMNSVGTSANRPPIQDMLNVVSRKGGKRTRKLRRSRKMKGGEGFFSGFNIFGTGKPAPAAAAEPTPAAPAAPAAAAEPTPAAPAAAASYSPGNLVKPTPEELQKKNCEIIKKGIESRKAHYEKECIKPSESTFSNPFSFGGRRPRKKRTL